jgi:DNA polymerase I
MANNICFTTLHPEGEICAPTNTRFVTPEKKRGLVPEILEQLMHERKAAKEKMKAAKSAEEAGYYNGLQQAIKTLMNSFYGVLASGFYRFTSPEIGASITAFARASIKNIISELTAENIPVIYADTDSIFIQSPHDNLEATIKFGEEIAARYSQAGTTLEFEKVLSAFFSHSKKRYVGNVAYPREGRIVRGYEIRRTDAFDLQSESLEEVFDAVLSHDIQRAVDAARTIVAIVRKGHVPVEKLVISRTVKAVDSYMDPDRMANVQAMRKLVERGYEFVPGMKVSYIVTNSKKTPQEVEPYIDGVPFEHTPDWEYYAERIAASLARVTEVFGWDENSLLSGIHQQSLFSTAFVRTEEKVGEKVKKAKKPQKPKAGMVRLEDFM